MAKPPGPLEGIGQESFQNRTLADGVGDATDPVDLAGDHISALEEAGGIHSHPHSGGGAGDEDGARRQRHALRELTDDVADIEEHLVRHAVLPQLSVDKASDGQRGRAGEFARGDNDRPHGKKGIQAFSEEVLLVAVLDVPGADVVGHAVSEDVVAHIFLPDMERVPAQDNGQLHFIIQLGDKIQMAVDRLPIAQGPEDIRQAQSLPASSELYLRPMDKLIQTAGSSALPVLIQGAVGTHKGVVARRIHTKSATEGTTLMRLQCRDLTEKNWDMLLNNAASPIHATGYTVYLENVDTLPKDLQQQVGTYIEDTKMTHRHRVISSSCCDLSAEVARGQFSSRLYLQLSGFTINVPSLAQRKEDIPAFVNMMIPQYNTALAKSTVGMEPDAMELMVEFEWPLNLVQLEKVLRQMIAASSGFYITAAEVAVVLQNEMRKVSALPPAVDLSGTLEDIERRVIEQVLREENMNQSAAAKRLGIGRSTLWRKIAGSGGK